MNKKLSFTLSAAAAMLFSGCSMCTTPIAGDPSCIENTHDTESEIDPVAITAAKPNFGPSKELFRPVFAAGNKRVSAIGSGFSLEDATNDAIGKILRENKCDYVVAVTRIISSKTHPTWRLFATTNYTVELSGLPIFLKSLSVEEKEIDKEIDKEKLPPIIVKCGCKCSDKKPGPEPKKNPLALLSLSEVKVNITAKGQTNDKVGVAFPAPKCAKAAK